MAMPRASLARRSFFVDTRALRRARRAVGARTDAETVRVALERVTEMEIYWRFMKRSRNSVAAGSFEKD